MLRQACSEWAALLRPSHIFRRCSAGLSLAQNHGGQLLPLSQAMQQLETVLLDPSLPPGARSSNQTAFTTLRQFVDSLSSSPGYPPASIHTVHFTDAAGKRVRCVLKTTGGDCSRLVQQSLGELLQSCGLSPLVYFDGDQFNPKPVARKPRAWPAPPAPAEVEAVRAKAAAAGFPSQTMTEAQFEELEAGQAARREGKEAAADVAARLRSDLQKLDPLFRACAAVPWMPRDEDGLLRVAKIRSEVVDHLEGAGWDVRGALARLWAGERSESVLCRGKEGGSKAAIQGLLFHAKQYDKDLGFKRCDT